MSSAVVETSDLKSSGDDSTASSGVQRTPTDTSATLETVLRGCTEIGIFTAKRNFAETITHLEPQYRCEFLRWIQEVYLTPHQQGHRESDRITFAVERGFDAGESSSDRKVSHESSGSVSRLQEGDRRLESLAAELREKLPTDAMSPKENIVFPHEGENADCTPSGTIHMDSFLYSNDMVDRMCDSGEIPRFYCRACGSRNLTPFMFISHSSSITQLRHIFSVLLPPLDGKVVVDVGSRLGSVLYGAYVYSTAAEIVGVEMNSYFCTLQQETIDQHSMNDRIKIVCDDIIHQGELVARADVIILNNVFEFFLSPEEQTKIWRFLRRTVQRGCRLITVPSLEKSFAALKLEDIDLNSWVSCEEDRLFRFKSEVDVDSEEDELDVIHTYITI